VVSCLWVLCILLLLLQRNCCCTCTCILVAAAAVMNVHLAGCSFTASDALLLAVTLLL
jgi:hypothetical protein